MKVKMLNRSSLKTKEKIKNAFAALLKEKKELSKVKVTDIIKQADITRGTFYTHYNNIYDVAKEFQEETLNVLVSNIENLKRKENSDIFFDTIINYLKENEEIYTMLLASDDPLLFMGNINTLILNNLHKVLDKDNLKTEEVKIIIFINGSIALVIKYFRKEIPLTLDEINAGIKETFKSLF